MFIKTVEYIAEGFVSWVLLKKSCLSIFVLGVALAIAHTVHAVPAQYPLFLANPVTPIMMLNMSNDHQLYFKVYDDYGDITDPVGGEADGKPDTTYIHAYKYYGYFDSDKCYVYESERFEPNRLTDNEGKCNHTGGSKEWSGNFLNWATMTRMDAVRKILYGGLRAVDTNSVTVLERAFLPHDAHSFAKFYDGNDIDRLTPFDVSEMQEYTAATGITICNTTDGGGQTLSQNVTAPPLIRVVKGNYSLWASNERWQCRWRTSTNHNQNGNDSNKTGIYAYSSNPYFPTSESGGEFNVRVEVCKNGLLEENCAAYSDNNYKPIGLLQKYGETKDGGTAKINFGLMTGSYKKNKSGGVLRRVVSDMDAEIKGSDGTFTNVDGVIKTLNKFRIYGYRYDNGTYHEGSGSDDGCSWGLNSFSNGSCTNWGNPQAEIYLESLRYLAGKGDPTDDFTFSGDDRLGLSAVDWGNAPVASGNYCAPLNVVQFNASTTSYDWDDLSTAVSDVVTGGLTTLSAWTNKLTSSSHENLTGRYFIGSNGSDNNQLCTPKAINNLSDVRGTCPDAPRLEGSYQIAGLAYYARWEDIMDLQGKQSVRTYGVELAPALPQMTISVPGSADKKKVTIIPACRNSSIGGNCAIVDFKVAKQEYNDSTNSGILYVNWEDSEQGGDYDQDMWGVIKYEVTASQVAVTTQVMAQSTGDSMGFGYIISGTENDGFHVHSGTNSFLYTPSCTNTNGSRCTCRTDASHGVCNSDQSGARSATYVISEGSGGAEWLKSPLHYAAKWGGYSINFEEDIKKEKGGSYTSDDLIKAIGQRDTSDSYYYATDPRKLEESLDRAFSSVAAATGSASSVATNSTRLSEGAFVYQAQFNSETWSGTLNAYRFNSAGQLPDDPTVSTADDNFPSGNGMQKTSVGRKVVTYSNSATVNLSWNALTSSQQEALRYGSETTDDNAQKRVDWLLGNATYEGSAGGLRERGTGDDRNILGDIVNSSPAYLGGWNFRYNRLPGNAGAAYQEFLLAKQGKDPVIFVGANDGMVHAFNAETLKEVFAYIPGIAFSNLASITESNYGKTSNPHRFIVDGPIAVGDVFIDNEWKSIIVGTLGAGGRGVYALDVTDRSNPKVLFELNESNFPQLGYIMGKPLIVPLVDGTWAAVFGNGDANGVASSLFVVDIANPLTNTKVISAPFGEGLSAPAILPNSIGQGVAAYAGDLKGYLWKFSLTDFSASPSVVFWARDGGNIPQPITAAPTLGINMPKGGVIMAYFGTGKYYDTGDNAATTAPVHSFYAIADIGTTVNRADLFEKTMITNTTIPFLNSTRDVVEDEAGINPDWTNDDGWYLDFDDPNSTGERVTTKAILIADKLIFPTLIPSDASCEYGGRSWLMEVVAVGDKFVGQKLLEDIKPKDFLILGDLGFGETDAGGAIVGSGTDATLVNEDAATPADAIGRQSWRQLK